MDRQPKLWYPSRCNDRVSLIESSRGYYHRNEDKPVPCPSFPIIVYGAECWTTDFIIRRRFDIFSMRCQRRLQRIIWLQHVTNCSTQHLFDLPMTSFFIRQRRLGWCRHLESVICTILIVIHKTGGETRLEAQYSVILFRRPWPGHCWHWLHNRRPDVIEPLPVNINYKRTAVKLGTLVQHLMISLVLRFHYMNNVVVR